VLRRFTPTLKGLLAESCTCRSYYVVMYVSLIRVEIPMCMYFYKRALPLVQIP